MCDASTRSLLCLPYHLPFSYYMSAQKLFPSRYAALLVLLFAAPALAQPSWSPAATQSILDNTLTLRFAPDLSALSEAEQVAVQELLEAGMLFQELYEDQNHPDAARVRANLSGSEAELYRMFRGPIATVPGNERRPFLDVRPETPGKNVYPVGVEREEFEAYLAAHPEERVSLLMLRGVVRRAVAENLSRDLATLDAHPALDLLHPGLRDRLETHLQSPSSDAFYGVPYAVAYTDRLVQIRTHLLAAADALADEDGDFADYLRLRANDLLTGNYEGGDAAWVSGQFNNLNAQIGSYETYDDALTGNKAFYSLSLLARDEARSADLAAALTDIQAFEDSLPYDRHKRVRSQIPVGVYNVIADFGQSRGTNTATILPNEADHARKYGRTILLRYNVMTDPELFALGKEKFCAGVLPEHCDDLTLQGGFQRTLWHEVGHYLGVAETEDGRTLGNALGNAANLLEEMKADLVSLFVAEQLHASGYHTDEALRSHYADGVRRVLQSSRPRRSQAYQTMQLMQWNYFMDRGLLTFEVDTGRLAVDYDRYREVVESLLREVLAVQSAGDAEAAEAFVERWTTWDDDLHGVIASKLSSAPGASYRLVRYAALGE